MGEERVVCRPGPGPGRCALPAAAVESLPRPPAKVSLPPGARMVSAPDPPLTDALEGTPGPIVIESLPYKSPWKNERGGQKSRT